MNVLRFQLIWAWTLFSQTRKIEIKLCMIFFVYNISLSVTWYWKSSTNVVIRSYPRPGQRKTSLFWTWTIHSHSKTFPTYSLLFDIYIKQQVSNIYLLDFWTLANVIWPDGVTEIVAVFTWSILSIALLFHLRKSSGDVPNFAKYESFSHIVVVLHLSLSSCSHLLKFIHIVSKISST